MYAPDRSSFVSMGARVPEEGITDISLQRASTAEVVAETLVRLIVTRALKSGEPLRETALARSLGISRNSLREGIRLLEQSRLVEYQMHRGAVVSTPNIENLNDLYVTRLHLETLAAQQEPTEEQLVAINNAFEELERSAASHEPERIIQADLGLHQSIVDILGSERISDFYRRLSKEMVFYFTVISYADEEFLHPDAFILSTHQQLRDAFHSGDAERASSLVREHIMESWERLRDYFTSQDS